MTSQRPLPDPYEVLGISRDASSTDISRAYRQLARALHPDSRPADAVAAADRLRAVIAAYEQLSDPARRAAHDQQARHHPVSPVRSPTLSTSRNRAAAQLHPLGPSDPSRELRPSRARAQLRPGPVHIEPPTGLDKFSGGDAGISAAEMRLLQLILHHLRHQAGRPW
jgi:curved DNA-binding protein CbpA